MQATAEKLAPVERKVSKTQNVRRLSTLIKGVSKKRRAELIRFHTCCADPRASK